MKTIYSKKNDGVALSTIFIMNQIVGSEGDDYKLLIVTKNFLADIDCLVETEQLKKDRINTDKIFVIADIGIKRIPERLKWLNKKNIIWISQVYEIKDACLAILKNIIFENEYSKFSNMRFKELATDNSDTMLHNMLDLLEKHCSDVKMAIMLINITYMYILEYGVNGKRIHRGDVMSKCIEFIINDNIGTDEFSYIEYEVSKTCLKRLVY